MLHTVPHSIWLSFLSFCLLFILYSVLPFPSFASLDDTHFFASFSFIIFHFILHTSWCTSFIIRTPFMVFLIIPPHPTSFFSYFVSSHPLLRQFPSYRSNKKGAGILDRAAKHKIPNRYLPVGGRSRDAYDEEVSGCLKKAGVQLVLMVRPFHCVKYVPIFFWVIAWEAMSDDFYIFCCSFPFSPTLISYFLVRKCISSNTFFFF